MLRQAQHALSSSKGAGRAGSPARQPRWGAVTLASAILISSVAVAAAAPEAAPTFTKDVAPILFKSCAICHRPGEVAPMPLLSYDQVRPWAKAIREKVVTRQMPPWYADNSGMKMRNDRTLAQEDIDTIARWVDAGAPKGDDAHLAALPTFAAGWENGQPDFVFEMPVEHTIPREGELPVLHFYVPIPFQEDRFAEVLELRPGNRAVLHHAGAYIVRPPEGSKIVNGFLQFPDGTFELRGEEGGSRNAGNRFQNESGLAGTTKLISFVPGRGLERHRPGTGKRIPAGAWLRFQMHYNPTGKPETDRSRLGIWFNTQPVTHEVLTRQAGDAFPTEPFGYSRYIVEGKELAPTVTENGIRRTPLPNIPPNVENWKIVGITPITEPTTLYGLSPHMHLRGKSLKWIVTWPDGRQDVVLNVPKYDFNWQIHYELAEPLKLPAGSTITGIGFYDNSVKNRYNPAPDREVYWAEQSWDEMYQAFTEYTIDSQDLTKRRPSTEQ